MALKRLPIIVSFLQSSFNAVVGKSLIVISTKLLGDRQDKSLYNISLSVNQL
jgi:hypothetical protein